uniref:DDE Tnp4 domain-containing protein n=1 Tax=Aegilops tauschii subsp. strangulata TaxID=200361 RepID=A0A453K441_AEGTS
LATVYFDLKFTYVLAGWEGSAHDANILSDSMSRPDGINIPDGKFYLGDAGYACRPGILPPFRKTRYHLNEFSGRNYPRTAQELFNLRHSSLRVTVERAFGALKNRFKILDQNHSTHTPLRLSLFLLVAFCITGSSSGALMNTCLRRKRSSLTMLLAPAMVWRHLTMTFGRTKGWSGQRQCSLTEVSAGFEED